MSARRALLALAAFLSCAAPAAAAPQSRIVGGTSAAAGAYPAQAQVSFSSDKGVFLCGGTLVAPQWVLTAGHCVSDEDTGALVPAADYTVRLGSTVLDAGTPYGVDQVSRAPGYSPQTLAYDAALLHLTTAAPEAPLPILALAQSAFAAPGTIARVVGWGAAYEGGPAVKDLQDVDVPIVSDATCHAAYGSTLVAATMVCAGYASGGRDACQGDSGGPMLVEVGGTWAVAGVVSTGDGCAEAGRYGIYTDTLNTTLRNWYFVTTGLTADSAPAPTPSPTPVATVATPVPTVPAPTAAPVAPAKPMPRAGLHLQRSCSLRACAFHVSFSGSGTVEAWIKLRLRTAQRLGFGSRRIAKAELRAHGTQTLRLVLPRGLRITRHAVPAELRVAAINADGVRTVAKRSVVLKP